MELILLICGMIFSVTCGVVITVRTIAMYASIKSGNRVNNTAIKAPTIIMFSVGVTMVVVYNIIV